MLVAAAMPSTAADPFPPTPVAVMWSNFGPTHHDRLRALAQAGFKVHAFELFSESRVYTWERGEGVDYEVCTLAAREGAVSRIKLFWRLFKGCRRSGARDVFLCHYARPAVFAAAVALRLSGRRVFTMIESKFDDYPRSLWREAGKSLLLRPYAGALVPTRRASDYVTFLGMRRKPIALGYSAIDVSRYRTSADSSEAEVPFADRPFLVVARLVPKKNIEAVLEAFAAYRGRSGDRRELHIIGYGPLRDELERKAAELGIGEAVRFLGFRESGEVAKAMAQSLALVLASTEEQFGLVVAEALATGLPVILSSNCGAVDVLIDNLGNGIVIDPYNIETIVLAMAHFGGSEAAWRAARKHALTSAMRGDAVQFSKGVASLVNG